MKIRLLEKKDIVAAAKIVGMNYSKEDENISLFEIKDMFGEGSIKPTYFVAEEKKEILGFAGFIQSWMDYTIYHIFWVNVCPDKQKQGVGQQLVTRIIREVKKDKKANLILLTTCSPSYYKEHFGFKTLEKFNNKSHALMSLSLEKK